MNDLTTIAYCQFKATNLEWIRCIPKHWEIVRIKHGFQTIGSGTTPSSNHDEFYDGDVPWVNTSELRENVVIFTEKMVTSEALREFSALKLYPKGSVLFAMYGATIGRVAILGIAATVNQAVCVLADPERFSGRYVFYGFQATRSVLEAIATGGGQPNLNAEKVREYKLPCPPIEEQIAIADYLDRETARIDALVAEKQRMLALLEEKRAALISRAVTRGLNPNAPLKPSGLDWLGDIPAHWETPPIYARFEVQLGKMLDEKKIKGTHLVPYLRNVDVQWGAINVSSLPEMDFDDDSRIRYSLKTGDILVCEGGEIGRTAIWGGGLNECYYQKALHRLRSLRGADDASFFVFVMRCLVDRSVFSSQATAATIQHLPAEKLRNVRYPSPPFLEQRAITSFLNHETARIDAIRVEIYTSIRLLKERRAALITAAVTGQISPEEMTA
ncbi:MAG: restriction endonuclease subunit S [Desulfoprunum sp.]|nr:restriction endonuclease subunit S [Desulfoprunum sp.]